MRGRNGERGKEGKKRYLYSLPNHTLTVCSGFRVCVFCLGGSMASVLL